MILIISRHLLNDRHELARYWSLPRAISLVAIDFALLIQVIGTFAQKSFCKNANRWRQTVTKT